MQVGELIVSLNLDTAQFNAGLEGARATLSTVGTKMTDIGKQMTAKVTAPIVGIGTVATKMAVDFNDAMAKVSTIADTTEVPLKQLEKSIMELSGQTGISSKEIANNVYDAISAGQSTGDAVSFVEKSTKLAKAGFAEAGQSLDLLTTIMNSYGLEAGEVNKVSDILIQTQNKGKTTVGELSSSMGKIIPTAKAANIGIEQLGAVYAVLTSKGIAAAEATTYTNSLLKELTASGTTASKALKDMSGLSFQELMDSGLSLADVLAMLKEGAEANGLSLTDMFGSAEAGTAALTLLGDGANAFNASVADMANSVGLTEEAFQKLQTDGEKARKAFNDIQNAMILLGNAIMPAIAPVAAIIADLALKFSELDEKTKTTIVVIAGIVAAVGPVLLIFGTLITTVQKVIAAKAALGAAITALSGPIGLTIAVIAGLIAIGVALWQNWDEIKANAEEVWNAVKKTVAETFEGMGKTISEFCSKTKEAWNNLWKNVGEFLATSLANIITGITGFVTTFATKWNDMKENISKKWKDMWEKVKTALTESVQTVVTKTVAFATTVVSKWEELKENVKKKWNEMWRNVTEVVSNAWSNMGYAFENLKYSIQSWFEMLKWNAYNWGRNMIQGFVDGINNMIGSVKSAVNNVINAAKGFIGFNSPTKKGEGRNIVKWGENMIGGFEDGILQAMPSLQKTMGAVIPAMGSIGGNGSVNNSYGGVTVQNLTVRNDADIDLIAKKLYAMQTRNGRGLGIV